MSLYNGYFASHFNTDSTGMSEEKCCNGTPYDPSEYCCKNGQLEPRDPEYGCGDDSSSTPTENKEKCNCDCPGGAWTPSDGLSGSAGLFVGYFTIDLTATCKTKPKLKVKLRGKFYGAGLVVSISSKMGLGGRIIDAPNCEALASPTSARVYSYSVGVASASGVFIGTTAGTRYELGGGGASFKFSDIIKGTKGISVMALWGGMKIVDKTCKNGEWTNMGNGASGGW